MMKASQWKQAVLESRVRSVVPVLTQPGIAILGRTVREAVTRADVHTNAVAATVRRFPVSAATTIMDLSVEAEAFGAPVRFTDHEVPTVMSRVVRDKESVHALNIPEPGKGRMGARLEAVRMTLKAVIDRPVFAGCIGPFSLAARLFDVSEVMMALYDQPEVILALLEKSTALLTRCCKDFKFAGAHGVLIAEPVAGMLSPEHCEEFSSKFVKRIVDAVQDDSFLVILHNCGDTDRLVTSMVGTGAAGLHFGNRCTMTDALKQIPPDILVFGNLDPVGTLKMGTPETVRRKTDALLAATKPYANFILSSGCDVPRGTPFENLDAFFDALKRFNAERGI